MKRVIDLINGKANELVFAIQRTGMDLFSVGPINGIFERIEGKRGYVGSLNDFFEVWTVHSRPDNISLCDICPEQKPEKRKIKTWSIWKRALLQTNMQNNKIIFRNTFLWDVQLWI